MADNGVFVPGLNGNNNSQQMLDRVMESKKVKLDEFEKDKDKIKEEKKAWNELKAKSVSLQNIARKMYGFEAPFDDKISKSSNENAFSANVTRNVEIGEYDIEILNKAESHRIASIPLNKRYKIDAGNYSIKVGNDEVKVSFDGGTVEKFASEIKKDSKNILKAAVTWSTPNTQVLVIESVKTGNKNFISFGNDKTKELFKDMGFFEEVKEFDKTFTIDKNRLEFLSKGNSLNLLDDKTIILNRLESYKYKLPEKISYSDRLIFEIDLRTEPISQSEAEQMIPTGPDFTRKGELNIFDIEVEGESPITHISPYTKPEKEPVIEDDKYIEIITNKRKIDLGELNVDDSKKTLRFDMRDIIGKDETIEAVVFKNNNTYKKVEAGNIHFVDEASKSGIRFSNEISKPQDARIIIDGIKAERDTNSIDDLIKGMTLMIYDKTDRQERLQVDRDYEKIVQSVTDFLSEFNGFLDLLNKETDTNADVDGNKGKFAGDYSLVSLGTRLRNIMMNPYQTDYGNELSLLAQIGVSTNESGNFRMDRSKLKGILEVKEDKFIEMMGKYPDGVKDMFGNDTNGDLAIDTGIAFEVEKLLKIYTVAGNGFFDNRDKVFDRELEQKDKDIATYKEKMDKDEQKLKKDLIKMEKATKDLEDNRKKFDNMNKK